MIKATIRQAILDRKALRIHFQGFDRDVCPHVLGAKNGRAQVLVFQYAGGSSSGLPSGGQWRCMPVAEITSAVVIEGATWHTGSSHSADQTCVDDIDVEVEY